MTHFQVNNSVTQKTNSISLIVKQALLAALLLAFSSFTRAEVFTASYENALKDQAFQKQMKALGSKLTDQDREILKSATAKIANALKSPGLKIGQRAPNIKLTNAYGESFNLNKALTKGPVILVFYRGAWCPFCNLHLKVLQDSLAAFEQYNASLVLVTPQKPDMSLTQFQQEKPRFEVLSDLNYQVAKAFNLYFEMPIEAVEIYKRLGIDLDAYNGEGRTGLPVPGTFIIDKAGIIQAQHAETDYSKRMEPADILVALEKISRNENNAKQ